jgi:hypothetical protein
MSSTPISYLTLTATAMGHTLVVVLAIVVTFGTMGLLVWLLAALSARDLDLHLLSEKEAQRVRDDHKCVWMIVFFAALLLTTIGFMIASLSYYESTNSVVEGMKRSVMVVISMSVVVAGCGALILKLGRLIFGRRFFTIPPQD